MKKRNHFILMAILGLCSVCFTSCDKMSSYETSLDTLFLDYHFGMNRGAFFDHCRELNKQGVTQHGTNDNNVMYIDSLNFNHNVFVNFYPKFENDVISEMPMTFNYSAWAPWNKELDVLELQENVVLLLTKWFGEGFKSKALPNGNKAYYKLDEPRLIRVFTKDDKYVHVEITNGHYKK